MEVEVDRREKARWEEMGLILKFRRHWRGEGGVDAYVEACPTRTPSNLPTKSDRI